MTSRFYYSLNLQTEDFEYYKQEDFLASVCKGFFRIFFKVAILYNNGLWKNLNSS